MPTWTKPLRGRNKELIFDLCQDDCTGTGPVWNISVSGLSPRQPQIRAPAWQRYTIPIKQSSCQSRAVLSKLSYRECADDQLQSALELSRADTRAIQPKRLFVPSLGYSSALCG